MTANHDIDDTTIRLLHSTLGALGGIRTRDLLVRSETRYPLRHERMRDRVNKGCLPDGVAFARLAGNRWSRMRDSNPRQPVYKTGALPAELTRRSWSGRRDSNPRIMAWEAIAVPLGYARITRDIIPADCPLVKPVTLRLRDGFLLAREASWSGWRDSNPRPPAPEAGALHKLRYSPMVMAAATGVEPVSRA